MIYDYAKIWKISYPILTGMLIQQLIGLTDTAFLGRVGEVELGASAIAGVFYIMIFMLGHGFGIGAQIIIARRNGEGNCDKTAEIFYAAAGFLIGAAAAVIMISQAVSPLVLKYLIQSPEIYEAAISYLDVRIYGLIFSFLIVVFRAFYVGITDTRPLTTNALIMLFCNVGLDYLLIFGKGGFSEMGIRGAALASVLSEAVSMLFFVYYTKFRIPFRSYGFQRFKIFSGGILEEIWRISVWTMLQSFLSLATWFLFFIAIEHLGQEALAISNILRSISALPFMIAAALGAAANSITSNLIGCSKSHEVMPTMNRIIKLGFLAGIGVEIVMALLPQATMRIYTDNTALITRAIPAYYAMLTVYLTVVPGMILFNAVSGSGHTKLAMFMELGALVIYVLNIWYVVVYLRADIAICWTSEHSYNIVLFLLTYYYLQRRQWNRQTV